MKKVIAFVVSTLLFLSIAAAPVWAAGGKERGDVGQGSTHQEGADAQGNQAP